MVLSKNDFMSAIKSRIGENPTDDDLKFIEDMTDTYDSLTVNDGEDWQKKYDENDAMWRKKYADRFFEKVEETTDELQEEETEDKSETITVDDLFDD